MHSRPSTWQFASVSLIAAAVMVVSAVAPTFAASANAHPGLHAAKSHSSASIPVRCKTRNKASGSLKYSDWQFPDTLNQYQTNASVSFETIYSTYEPLTQFNGGGRPYADMIEKLPTFQNGGVRDGGKTIAVNLKKGLRWSDGAEITAADVKFGWKIGSNKNSGPLCQGSCDVISRIDTSGKYGIVFHLKSIFAPFIPNGLPPVWPVQWKGAWTKGDVNTATTKLFQDTTFNFEDNTYPTNGAYQVATYVKDDRIVLKPMRYYSTMACGARVAQLIFAFYAAKPSMIAAAASHQTDTSTDYTLADLPGLKQHTDAYTLHNDPGYLIEHLTFNVDAQYNGKPNPLSNLKVRQALALSLDKYGLIRSALSMSKKEADTIIAWSPLIITKALVQPFADKQLIGQWDPIAKKYITATGTGVALADAKKLLTQAGFPGGGFSLDGYTTTGNPVRAAQFAIVQKSFSNVGVTFNPNYAPASKLFGQWGDGGILKHGGYQVGMYADVGYPDPDGFKYNFQHQYVDREQTIHSSVNANDAGIHDPTFDTAFNKAAASFDPKVRQKWYNIWQVGLNQKAYWVPLFYRGSITTADAKIGNFKSNPTNAGDEWNTFQWIAKGKT